MATGDITGITPDWSTEFNEILKIRRKLENEDGNLSWAEVKQLRAHLAKLERKVNPRWGR